MLMNINFFVDVTMDTMVRLRFLDRSASSVIAVGIRAIVKQDSVWHVKEILKVITGLDFLALTTIIKIILPLQIKNCTAKIKPKSSNRFLKYFSIIKKARIKIRDSSGTTAVRLTALECTPKKAIDYVCYLQQIYLLKS